MHRIQPLMLGLCLLSQGAIAQVPDGTIWVGNGSLQGDVWKASPPTGVTPQKLFSCG